MTSKKKYCLCCNILIRLNFINMSDFSKTDDISESISFLLGKFPNEEKAQSREGYTETSPQTYGSYLKVFCWVMILILLFVFVWWYFK